MADSVDVPHLSGTLKKVPFAGNALERGVREAYQEVRDSSDVETVLILTRGTRLIEPVEEWLGANAAGAPVNTTVQSLTQHAAQTHSMGTDGRKVASLSEQLAVLVSAVEGYDWTQTDYLAGASQQESFISDLSRLVTAILTQDIAGGDVDDEDLREIVTFAYEVKDRLEQAGRTDLSRVIHEANDVLRNGGPLPKPVPDAIIVVNFEEFVEREREYVAHISEGRQLFCVAKRASSVYRTGEEPGDPCTAPGLSPDSDSIERSVQVKPHVVATRLATGLSHAAGEVSGPGTGGSVRWLNGETFQTHVRAIADEIHRLTEQDQTIGYDDVAVVVRDSRVEIDEVVRLLWNQNIPVSTATANGLEYDPAARELYQVVAALAALEADTTVPDETVDALATRLEQMEADGEPRATVRALLDSAYDTERFDDALGTWIAGSELKGRIASGEEQIQARISAGNVRDVFEIVEFIETNELCATWAEVQTILEQLYERQLSDEFVDTLDTSTSGVVVETARGLTGVKRKAVFAVGVVEDEYPTSVPTNPLFPLEQARDIDPFPLLVQASADDVTETFPTMADETSLYDPLKIYYRELDRRLLANVAQTASEHLYLCTYRQDRSGLSKYRPSRFFEPIREEVDIRELDADARTQNPDRATVAAFDESRRELRGAADNDPVDMAELRERFQAVQSLVDSQGDDRVADALQTRVEFLRGEIRRTTASGGNS